MLNFTPADVANTFCLPAGQGVFAGDKRIDVEKVTKGDVFNTVFEHEPEGLKRDCEVVETYENGLQNIVRLRFRVENGKEFEVRSSVGHRFYVRELGFQHAQDVSLGSRFVNHLGQTVELISRELENEPQFVYNFQVEDAHTYFVGDDAECCVLGHNADCMRNKPGSIYDRQIKFVDSDGNEYFETRNEWLQRLFDIYADNRYLKEGANNLHNIYLDASIAAIKRGANATELTTMIRNNKYYAGHELRVKTTARDVASGIADSAIQTMRVHYGAIRNDVLKSMYNDGLLNKTEYHKLKEATEDILSNGISDVQKAEIIRRLTIRGITLSPVIHTGPQGGSSIPSQSPNHNQTPNRPNMSRPMSRR